MKLNLLLTVAVMILSSTPLWGAGRVNAPADPAKRCMNAGVAPETCESYRARALAAGCIDREEYEALKRYGAYPTCNALKGEGMAQLDGWCPCGCFHPLTMISTIFNPTGRRVDVAASIVAQNRNAFELVNLSSDASLSAMTLASAPIRISTAGIEKRPLVIITTVDGRVLRVTEKHPVLLASGKMVQALALKKSDKLITEKGSAVAIRKIERKLFKGEVVNFSTETESKNGHVIFAEGLAVGDLYWQSSLEDELNQIVIRK